MKNNSYSLTSLFKNDSYKKLWGIGLLQAFMRWMELTALGIFVFQITESAFWVAMVGFSHILPLFLFGSILGLSAIVLGVAWKKLGLPLPLAILVALSVGTLAGLFNGIIITRFKVPPLIATLATLALYRGLAEGISQARSIRGYPEWFFILGQGEFFGIPTQLWIVAFFTLLTGFILTYTTWGRATYAIGANETAARFSGIAVDKTKLFIYAASGFAASLAAIIFVSRVSTTRSDMGMGLELDAITAVVLGGTSIFGGKGTIVGTFFGLILIQILKNGLSLAGVKSDGTYIAIGLVLILTLLISNLFNRNSEG